MQTFNLYFVTDLQCVSDSWQNTIGSAAIAIVLAICTSTWKTQMKLVKNLPHLPWTSLFLYEKSDGNDPEVSTLFYLTYEVYA